VKHACRFRSLGVSRCISGFSFSLILNFLVRLIVSSFWKVYGTIRNGEKKTAICSQLATIWERFLFLFSFLFF
jgi:hypothetical protein